MSPTSIRQYCSRNWLILSSLSSMVLLRYLPNDPARVAGSEHPVWDVPGDHTPRPDDCPGTDPHAWADDRPTADPHIRPDLDGPGILLPPAQFGVHRVGGRVDLHLRAEQREVADPHQAHVEHHAVG